MQFHIIFEIYILSVHNYIYLLLFANAWRWHYLLRYIS